MAFQRQQFRKAAAEQNQREDLSADYTTVIPPTLALTYMPIPQTVMHLPAKSRSRVFHWLLHQPARTLSVINTPNILSLVIFMHLPMKMVLLEGSETSAMRIVKPGNYTKLNILHTGHGENLKLRILHPYAEVITRHKRLLVKLRIKKIKLLTSRTFLLRCRDHNTILRYLQFHHHIHSRAANIIYQRTSLALQRERFHHNRQELDSRTRELLSTHLRIANLFANRTGLCSTNPH